jgi:arsenite-transporting ATPase
MMAELAVAVPGVDEMIAFGELMKSVQQMNYSTIVFDTAPTGHTLRFINLPQVLNTALEKLMTIKPTIEQTMSSMLSVPPEQIFQNVFAKIEAI